MLRSAVDFVKIWNFSKEKKREREQQQREILN